MKMEEDWQTKKATIRDRAEMLFVSKDLCDCEFLVGSQKIKVRHLKFVQTSGQILATTAVECSRPKQRNFVC